MTTLTIPPEAAGQRLDVWLGRCLTELSRARLQALIRAGHVTLAGQPAKPSQKLAAGLIVTVTVPAPEPSALVPEAIPLAVLFEDADLIVIDKPPGLVVHPAAGHASGTLANALVAHCRDLPGIGGERRPGIVHRLDRDTSGVMVVAKTESAMRSLVTQFKDRQVQKEYLALVWGTPAPAAGRTETLIGRSAHDRKKMSARPPRGRPAVTLYTTLEVLPPTALLRVRIETGRTHQIRVHLAFLGHPVVGDAQYGRRHPDALPGPAPRQMLHAARLGFTHPRTGQALTFEAPLPADMTELITALRRQAGAAPERGRTP